MDVEQTKNYKIPLKELAEKLGIKGKIKDARVRPEMTKDKELDMEKSSLVIKEIV